MAVAKSYQKLDICGDPYEKNGRAYIVVSYPDGRHKEVRWYTDAEYKKMYPEEKVSVDKWNAKKILGFEKGYITIFKGDIKENEEWFKLEKACRYHTYWGWYVISTEDLPEPMPLGVEAVRLEWSQVGYEGEVQLRSESEVKAAVQSLMYEPSNSKHIGSIGERLDLELTIAGCYPKTNHFGTSYFHVMKNADGDVFTWHTSARQLEVGKTYNMRGTIKEHILYKNEKQNVLTRCQI